MNSIPKQALGYPPGSSSISTHPRSRQEHAGQGQTGLVVRQREWGFGGHVKLTDGNIAVSHQDADVHTNTHRDILYPHSLLYTLDLHGICTK